MLTITIISLSIILVLTIYDIITEDKKDARRNAEYMSKERCGHCLYANHTKTYCFKRRIDICYWDDCCGEYYPASKTFSPADDTCRNASCPFYKDGECKFTGETFNDCPQI